MKVPFLSTPAEPVLRQPAPACLPHLPGLNVGALYRGARVGGDFFDFAPMEERLVLLLLDIAGERATALHLATSVQETFRKRAPEIFATPDANEADGVTELVHELNRAVLQAANGVRCAPGFIACYNQALGTLSYVNAGHTPALVRDASGVTALEPSGLPLGLFSHATHDTQLYVLQPNAVLVLVSRGLVEVRAGRREFGLEGVKRVLATSTAQSGQELCAAVLEEVENFARSARRNFLRRRTSARDNRLPLSDNDTTVVALVRAALAGEGRDKARPRDPGAAAAAGA